MPPNRRSILASIGLALPVGLLSRPRSTEAAPIDGPAPTLRFRSFESAVRTAFSGPNSPGTCHRIEVGFSDTVQAGLQGSTNDRAFAGFPAGQLRIVRSGTAPGPIRHGVRLFVATVDVVRSESESLVSAPAGRPLDFASLPPAPVFA